MRGAVAAVALAALAASAAGENVVETFSQGMDSWVASKDAKYEGGKWKVTSEGAVLEGDAAIRTDVRHKFYGLTKVLGEPVKVDSEDGFVMQYEVRYPTGVTCSGAYVKLLEADSSLKPEALKESTPYSIMFGPDVCGSNHKVHLIFRQQNPVTKEWEEKHMTKAVKAIKDNFSHLYTLEVKPDNSFRVLVDNKEEARGSLTTEGDFAPSFVQAKEIDDPEDKKPADWVDKEKIPDPEATKPEDWDEDAPKEIPNPSATKPSGWLDDEPAEIGDPEATQPEDWDEEDDGKWEPPLIKNPACTVGCGEWKAPLIKNPAYKGKWSAPLVANPEYKGEWKPRRIANPGYFDEPNPVGTIRPVGAIAIEILANDIVQFDSIMIGNDLTAAKEYASGEFATKSVKEHSSDLDKRKQGSHERRLRAYEDGLIGAASFYLGELGDLIGFSYEQNPAVTGFVLVGIVVIPLLLTYWYYSRSEETGISDEEFAALKKAEKEGAKDAAKHKKDDDDAVPKEAADDEDVEDDEEDEDEDEDEAAEGVRRRIPKAN